VSAEKSRLYLLIPGIGQAGGKASAKPLTRPWGF
jgi:hypothetical protein